MLGHLNKKINMLTRWQLFVICVAIVALVGYIDYATGYEISMSFLYVGPIALITWYAGKNSGLALSIIAGAVLIFIARAAHQEFAHPAILYWNTLLQIAYYVFIVILISKVHASLMREKKLARVDVLTNIPNRLTFIEQLNSSFYLAVRSKAPLSLAYIDIDDFKYINDIAKRLRFNTKIYAASTLLVIVWARLASRTSA
jgi:hypothetical protein